MKIAFVTAEIAPFAKVGGLADVSAALPVALHHNGHQVRVFAPLYRRARTPERTFEPVPGLERVELKIGPHTVYYSVKTSVLPKSDLPIYFIDVPGLYDREGIYTQDPDEHLRYVALSYAALSACQHMGFSPDIVHANDWQTALLPLILKARLAWDQNRFPNTKSVLTIHNLAHQGVFGAATVPDTGLQESAHLFHQDQLKEGFVNYLLTGILYSTAVTTVSPTYAAEVQTDLGGGMLAPFLRARRSTVVGILNGIGADEWDPQTDTDIKRTYSADSLDSKEENKADLLAQMGLPYSERTPVLGIVSRLTWQKGFEIVFQALPPLLSQGRLQLVVLGSGAGLYEAQFTELQRRYPRQVSFYRGFSNKLAHMIEAGADMFLMPSRFEPCGLNQMYSLRYGTVPIVRKTGGLADTVTPFDPSTGQGTGFVFELLHPRALSSALGRALAVWPNRRAWRQLQLNGMAKDYTWERQVQLYEELYRRVMTL